MSGSIPLRTPLSLWALGAIADRPEISCAYDGETVVKACEWCAASPIAARPKSALWMVKTARGVPRPEEW